MKKIAILILLHLCSQEIRAQATYNRLYNFNNTPNTTADNLINMVVLSDGSKIYGGATQKNNKGVQPLLVKCSLEGDTLWVKKPKVSALTGIITDKNLFQINPNKILLIGVVADTGLITQRISYYPYFHFFNANGDSLHTVMYKDTNNLLLPQAATLNANNEIILSGFWQSAASRVQLAGGVPLKLADSLANFISKFDSNGTHITTRYYNKKKRNSETDSYVMYNIITTYDGGLLMCRDGTLPLSFINGYPYAGMYIVKLDSMWNVQWQKQYKPSISSTNPFAGAYAYFKSNICKGENDTTFYCITTGSTDRVWYDNEFFYNRVIYYGKIGISGVMQWDKIFADTLSYLGQFFPTKDSEGSNLTYYKGKLYLIGRQYNPRTYFEPILVVTDSLGKVQSLRDLGNANVPNRTQGLLYDIEVSDSTINVCGYLEYFAGFNGSYLQALANAIQLDNKGCLQPGCDSVDVRWQVNAIQTNNAAVFEISIFPNPTQGLVNINTSDTAFDIAVYNTQGQCIIKQSMSYNYSLDLSNYPSGLYYLRVSKDKQQQTLRLVKE